MGYSFAVITSYMHTSYLFLCATAALSVLLGYFFSGHAWLNDLCGNINSMNDNGKFEKNPKRMIEQISDIIATHSAVIQLSAMCFGLIYIPFYLNSIITIVSHCFQTIQ